MREKIRLGDVCTIVSGTTPKTGNDEYWNGEILWVTPAELTEESFILNDTVRKITEKAVKESSLKSFPKGTVLLSSRAPIGKVAIAGQEMYCNQGFKNFICNEKLNNEYLYWFLKGKKAFLNSLGRGATFKEVSKSIVENIEIPLPDIVEQKNIASLMNTCQSIIALKKQQMSELDFLIKSRFVEMFDLDTYPMQRMIDIIKTGAGLSYGIIVPGDNVPNGIPMIRPSDFKNERINFNNVFLVDHEVEKKYKKTRLNGNELLVQVIGQPGQVMLTDGNCKGMNVTRNLAVIRQDDTVVNKFYLKHYLTTQKAQISMLGGSNQSTLKQLPLGALKKIDIPLPPISLQNQFSEIVQEVDKLKVRIQKSLDETQELFDSLMQKFFE